MQDLWQFYLLIMLIFVQGKLLENFGKRGKLIFIGLCFVELSFLAGFRDWSIGNDTHNYINVFILSGDYPQLLGSHMEWGYLLYNQFLAFFTSNPQILLIVTAIFITGSWLYTFYKYSVALTFSTLLFIILEYSTTLSMLRQEMAVCVILLAVPFIIRRQFLFFLLAVWLASTVHSSAFLALGLYFLYSLPFKKKYVIWVLVAALLTFFFLAPILEKVIPMFGRYGGYVGTRLLGEPKVASIIKTIIQFAIVGFLLFSDKYIVPRTHNVKSLLPASFLLWCSVIAFCLQFISIRGTVLERLVIYFYSFNFISIPYFVHCYPKKMRALVALGLFGCFVLYKSIVFIYRPEWNYVLPFKFCF